MFVLYPRDPARCQIGKIWTMPNEIVKVRSDRYVICNKETTARYLMRKGFHKVELMEVGKAAKQLEYPFPVLTRWASSGKVTIFKEENNQSWIPVSQVNQLKLDKEQTK